jgi:sarcosine oxidase
VTDIYDVVVVGLGGIGGHVALRLAERGVSVLGLEAHRPPHSLGSSHGNSRVIREAYFEGVQYVPLVRRAYDLWEELERRAGRPLVHITGAALLGTPDSETLRGVRLAEQVHGVPLTPLTERDRRVFRLAGEMTGLREARGGWIEVEPAIAAVLELAAAEGAELRFDTPVLEIDRDGPACRVRTADGEHAAERVVVAAGAWASSLVPELAGVLEVERQVLAWFDPLPESPDCVWLAEWAPDRYVYGFPPDADGLKMALHHDGTVVTPGGVDRAVGEADIAALRHAVAGLLGPLGAVRRSATCLYTNTPDRHFALGPLPGDPRIVVASACSGHGFKFLPATGEAVAAFARGETPPVDVSSFAVGRLLRRVSSERRA